MSIKILKRKIKANQVIKFFEINNTPDKIKKAIAAKDLKIKGMAASLMNMPIDTNLIVPGLEVIGRGYDIFGKYANNDSLLDYNLFDFSGATWGKVNVGYGLGEFYCPDCITLNKYDEHKQNYLQAETSKKLLESMNVDANISGSFLGFGASVSGGYTNTDINESKFSFIKYDDIKYLWKLTLTSDIALLRKYMKPEVKTDLYNMSPLDIFSKWGAYFLRNVCIGGKIDYSTTYNSYKCINIQNIRATAEVSYFGVSGSTSMTSQTEKETFRSNSETNVEVCGGNTSLITLNWDTKAAETQAWADSVKDISHNPPEFIDFNKQSNPSKNPLFDPYIPIWELIEVKLVKNKDDFDKAGIPGPFDTSKLGGGLNTDGLSYYDDKDQRRVKDAFADYAKKHQPNLELKVITEISTITGDISTPGGWIKIDNEDNIDKSGMPSSGDLNLNAGGEHLFFIIQKEIPISGSFKAITGLKIREYGHEINDSEISNESSGGWEIIRKDLNKGAGGKYIYLFVKKEINGAGITPLKSIRVVHSKDEPEDITSLIPAKYQYLNNDLNHGAGGDYVYLCYSTEI